MGFLSEFKKASEGAPEGDEAVIAGKQLACPHCGATRFTKSRAQLNTPGMTFLDLDFLNRTVNIYECAVCGRIQWFAERQ